MGQQEVEDAIITLTNKTEKKWHKSVDIAEEAEILNRYSVTMSLKRLENHGIIESRTCKELKNGKEYRLC